MISEWRSECPGCHNDLGIFKTIPGKICSICYDHIKRDTGYSVDEMHELDLNQIKISLAPKKKALK